MPRRLPRNWASAPTPILLFVSDSTGAGVGSLTYASAITISYYASGASSATTVTLVTATAGTYTSSGFVASAAMGTGWYELGLPIAALPEGGRCVVSWSYNGITRTGEIVADDAPTTLTAARAGTLPTTGTVSTYAGTDTPGVTTLLAGVTLADGAITAAKIGASALNGKGDWGTATNLANVLSAVQAINNLSALANLTGATSLEIPDSGSTLYPYTLVVRDTEGHLADLSATPTLAVQNAAGTDRSSNLSAVTRVSVGRYAYTYTVSASAAKEALTFAASGTAAADSTARLAILSAVVSDVDQSTAIAAIQSGVAGIVSGVNPVNVGAISGSDPSDTIAEATAQGISQSDEIAGLPTDLTNLKAWYRGDAGRFDATTGGNLILAQGVAVARWEDQSGGGRHATQATSGLRPLARADGTVIGALNVDNHFELPTTLAFSRQDFAIFFVCELNVLRRTIVGFAVVQAGVFGEFTEFALSFDATTGCPYIGGGVGGGASTLRLPSGRSLVGFVGTPAGLTIYVNDASQTVNPLNGGTFSGGRLFGHGSATYPLQAAAADVLFYDRAITPAEVDDVIRPYAVARGATFANAARRTTVVSGDSISSSAWPTLLRGWQQRVARPAGTLFYNNSEPGITLATLAGDSATRDAPLYRAGAANTILFAAGRNDLGAGTAATAIKSILATVGAARRADGFRVVVATVLPHGSDDAGVEAQRQAYNASLRADFGVATHPAYADGLLDWDADPVMGALVGGAVSGAVYDPDQLHPNDAGHALLAKHAAPHVATAGYAITGGGAASAGVASPAYTLTIATGGEFRGQMAVRISADGGATVTVTSPGATLVGNNTASVTVTPAAGQTSLLFSVTRPTEGASTLTFANGQGWVDAAAIGYATTIASGKVAATVASGDMADLPATRAAKIDAIDAKTTNLPPAPAAKSDVQVTVTGGGTINRIIETTDKTIA